MRWEWLASAVAIAVVVPPAPARADENWAFVRLSCSRELRFFEASRINLHNLPHATEVLDRRGAPRPSAFKALARTQGIYDIPTLGTHPFACQTFTKPRDWQSGPWPSFTVAVRKVPKSWSARITVNGVPVGRIDLAEEHAWFGVRYISVEANGVGIWVRVCTEGEDARCREGYLKDMKDLS